MGVEMSKKTQYQGRSQTFQNEGRQGGSGIVVVVGGGLGLNMTVLHRPLYKKLFHLGMEKGEWAELLTIGMGSNPCPLSGYVPVGLQGGGSRDFTRGESSMNFCRWLLNLCETTWCRFY